MQLDLKLAVDKLKQKDAETKKVIVEKMEVL